MLSKAKTFVTPKKIRRQEKKRFERKKSKFAGTIHGTEIGV